MGVMLGVGTPRSQSERASADAARAGAPVPPGRRSPASFEALHQAPINIRGRAHPRFRQALRRRADGPDGAPVSAASRLFGRKIKTRERAEEAFGLPVTAEIPAAAPRDADGSPEVEVASRPDSESAQAYRELAAQIEQAVQHDTGAHARSRRAGYTVLVTSARDEPARSFVAVNLAAVFAETGHRVLVVTTRGLLTASAGNDAVRPDEAPVDPAAARDVVAHALPSRIAGVSSLALGAMFASSEDVLRGFDDFADAATEVVDLVVIEAPLLAHQLGRPLLAAVDLSVVVCEGGRTTTEDGFESQAALTDDVFLPILGLVLAHPPE